MPAHPPLSQPSWSCQNQSHQTGDDSVSQGVDIGGKKEDNDR
jgi:hypothetical protein